MVLKSCLTLLICCNFVDVLYSVSLEASIVSEPAANIALTPGHEISLKCTAADFPDIQFSWHRRKQDSNGYQEPEEELFAKERKYIVNNGNLILKSPTLNDVGDYFCRVKEQISGLSETEKMISIRARPHIYDFDLELSTIRSAVAIEGQELRIYCNVEDFLKHSQLVIKWQTSLFDENEDMNEVHSGEDGIRIERQNSTCSALIIDKVAHKHRRFFKCNVTNGLTDNSKVIYIRVRDKYSTVWPAVAICLELVILLGIIFFSDSRKVKPDKDMYESKVNM